MKKDIRKISDAAEAVKISRQGLYKVIRKGGITAYRFCGMMVVDMADVYRWAAKRKKQ